MLNSFARLCALLLIFQQLQLAANEMRCRAHFHSAAPVDSSAHRKFAPDRFVDVLHMIIEVTPDFVTRSVSGRTTLRFRPLTEGQRELRLNARDLRVSETTASLPIQHVNNTGEELIITFGELIPTQGEQQVTITYEAYPQKGLYFRTRQMGYAPEDEHLFTQGADIEARHWFPCYDSPNDKFTNELICHLPEQMTALSNGALLSEEPAGNGLKRVHWSQDKPHTSYLICLVAGNFKKIEDSYRDIPLAFYTPASQIGMAESSFRETKEMMEYFEREIGVPYPWAKYFQVCIQDFMWGGMENTSLTTLTDNTLFPAETENIRSSQGLVAHELAHQWFGDLVTCEDWSQIWLNEGFASYYELLFKNHKDGRDAFLYALYENANEFINKPVSEDSRPVVFRKYDVPLELFGYLVYPKGAWVLHMLRSQLGEELYRQCIRTYLERHQFGNVETHDLMEVVEELSGRSWDQFFDQWVFRPHRPELQVRYEWNEQKKLAKVTIAQTQQLTNDIALFRFPLTIRFKGPFGVADRTVDLKEKEEAFYFPLESAPKIVRIDPDYTLLARVNFDPPRELVLEQLKDHTDVMGRIFALQQLSKSKDKKTVDIIAERLASDPFHGVRIEAAQALRKIHNDDALKALIAHAQQEDARVRQMVVSQIGTFHKDEALQFALGVVEREKNPEIRQAAVRTLGSYPEKISFDLLLGLIRSESYLNVVASSAIAAARGQNDARYIEPILDALRAGSHRFARRRFAEALDAAAYLARNEENKDAVYRRLTEYTEDPRSAVRIGAIRALGTLRDDRALAVLEKFAGGLEGESETREAKRATELIRSQRPMATEVNTLRNEVLELKKQHEEFKKTVEELKKQGATQPEKKESSWRAERPAKQESPANP